MGIRHALAAFAAPLLAMAVSADAAVILDYNLTGATTASPPATWNATTVAPGTSGGQLSRGAGIVAAGLTNGFSSNDWTVNPTGTTLSQAQANAVTNNDYYQFSFSTDPTIDTVSISTFNVTLRRSAVAAPDHYDLYASFDGFATAGTLVDSFTYVGRSSGTAPGTVTPGQWMTTDTPGQDAGNPITPQDLSTVPSLQNIGPNQTVTFRLFAYGNITGAAASNTVALGRFQGPKLDGTVVQTPEPGSVVLLGAGLVGAACTRGRRRAD